MTATRSVETLAYSGVKTDGDVELQRYSEMVLAEVTCAVTPRDLTQSDFSPSVHMYPPKIARLRRLR